MKVIQILPALNGGGVEKGTLEVADYLIKNGVESVVVSAGGKMVARLVSSGTKHINMTIGNKSLLTFRHVLGLRKLILKEKPDVIDVRSRLPAWICKMALLTLKKRNRPKVVTTVHGFYSVNYYSRIMVTGDVVVAVSNAVKEYVVKNYKGIREDKIVVIHRGVDLKVYNKEYRPPSDWVDKWFEEYKEFYNKKLITLPGRLTRLKGHNDFVLLMKELKERDIDVKGFIVGEHDDKKKEYIEDLKKNIDKYDLVNDIIISNSREDIRNIYMMSDVILSLSSKPEAFGRTVAEGLSLGKQVYGYAHGGVKEIFDSCFPYGYIESGNIEQLADKVSEALDSPKPIAVMPFCRERMLYETLKCYQQLIEEKI